MCFSTSRPQMAVSFQRPFLALEVGQTTRHVSQFLFRFLLFIYIFLHLFSFVNLFSTEVSVWTMWIPHVLFQNILCFSPLCYSFFYFYHFLMLLQESILTENDCCPPLPFSLSFFLNLLLRSISELKDRITHIEHLPVYG